jgi:hypothetical protein
VIGRLRAGVGCGLPLTVGFRTHERNGAMGKGRVYNTRHGKVRVVRVGGQTIKLDSHGNVLSVKVSTGRQS